MRTFIVATVTCLLLTVIGARVVSNQLKHFAEEAADDQRYEQITQLSELN